MVIGTFSDFQKVKGISVWIWKVIKQCISNHQTSETVGFTTFTVNHSSQSITTIRPVCYQLNENRPYGPT